MKRTVHHYHVEALSDRSPPTSYPVPKGSRVVSASLRNGDVAVYVEKPVTADNSMQTLLVFHVGTGWEFEDFRGADFVDTVRQPTGTVDLFWHVYASIR